MSAVSYAGQSDHCMVTASIKMHRALPKSTKILTKFIHDFRIVDWHKVRSDLMKAPIQQAIQGTENIDSALAVWENMIMAVLQHRVPTRGIRMKSQRKMWMTSEIYHLSKRKLRLFKIARSTRPEDDWSKYARFRNFCTSRFRSAKANFLRRKHEEISSATDGSHRWWTLAKKLARITTPRVKPYRNYAQLSIPQPMTLTSGYSFGQLLC